MSSESPIPEHPLHYRNGQHHDEAYTREGEMRPHWQYLLDSLSQLGTEEMAQRHLKTQRILRDDGAIASSVAQKSSNNIWELDPVPILLQSDEWSEIESGLSERAELLNRILQDLYGDQELIHQGLIPPELVYGHKGFLRSCHQMRLPGEQQLIMHSADMVRTDSGELCILTDRIQVPRGIGYTLENRTVMSRVFPSLFRDSQVHRLALFYQALRQKLHDLAPKFADRTPGIVLMTPGAYSPFYFEHTYLANYLGYPLVQGGDLTVRNGKVWMKSVNGLHPVDVILRFVDDSFCDPVELNGQSQLGVPGLLEAARAGSVMVVNPIGAGLLENPALMKYLPAISEYLMGRPVKLRSVDSFWGGDAEDLSYILDNFDQLVLKGINPLKGGSVLLREIDTEQQQQWRDKLIAEPHKYVAQAFIQPSSSPTLKQGELVSRPILMRSFTVASGPSYSVMPGCLTRTAPEQNDFRVSSVMGSVTKDTWVLASEPEKQLSLQTTIQRQKLAPISHISLPSRVVENLFWMGRYAERSESSARLLRAVMMQLNSNLVLPTDSRKQMLKAITRISGTQPGFLEPAEDISFAAPDSELLSVILDSHRSGSLQNTLEAMLSCADEVKEQLSADAQRIVNDIRDEMVRLTAGLHYGLGSAPEEALDPLVTSLLALSGQAHESMFRGTGWRFLQMGRLLEKICLSAELIRAMLVDCFEGTTQSVSMETMLLSMEALISYRRRYAADMNVDDCLQLLLLDKSNPRSLLFLLDQLEEHLKHLSGEDALTNLLPEQKQILRARTDLMLLDLEELTQADKDGLIREQLEEFLSQLQERLYNTADNINDRYFDHTGGPQQLIQPGWEQQQDSLLAGDER